MTEISEGVEEVSDGLVAGDISEDDLSLNFGDIENLVIAPTDWTVSVLLDLLKRGKIDLQPKYQRRVAWDERKMSRFIESLVMHLPVPQIVLAEMKTGGYAVIDGKQRINSIARFCLDDTNPLILNDCQYRTDLNGKSYEDLLADGQREAVVDAFQSQTVRTVVLKNWKADGLLYLLFLRLNQNSVPLSPQELRRALFPGDFMNWLDDKTAASTGMQKLFANVPDFRMRDMEVATRYLAFSRFAGSYTGNMKTFLDEASNYFSKNFAAELVELEKLWASFEEALLLTASIFGKDAFKSRISQKYQRSHNRAVVDIMTYYFSNSEVRSAATAKREDIKAAFERLCDTNPDFLTAIQTSTKSIRATAKRFKEWENALKEILGDVVPAFPLPADLAER